MTGSKSTNYTRIWDIWIRVFHWSFAATVIFMLVSGETGFLFFDWHQPVGEFVLALLLFRICWGFVGSSNARLISLFVNPLSAVKHLVHLLRGTVSQERGHNAAGGWAVLVMLLLIAFQAISGLFIADEDELIEGAFYGSIDYDISERLLHMHHLNAKILMIVIGIHVFMVFFYLVRAGHNLITPMITGKMRWLGAEPARVVKFANPALGLVLLVACLAVAAVVFGWKNF